MFDSFDTFDTFDILTSSPFDDIDATSLLMMLFKGATTTALDLDVVV